MERDEVEAEIIKAFVIAARRDKYLEALPNPKRRSKVLDRLNHHIDDIDVRYRILPPSDSHTAAAVEKLLRSRGAPPLCYVISSSPRLDRRGMSLVDALNTVIGYQIGALISCIPGRLGFYESEESKSRYILERKTE
jgi:hypothetical protein